MKSPEHHSEVFQLYLVVLLFVHYSGLYRAVSNTGFTTLVQMNFNDLKNTEVCTRSHGVCLRGRLARK